MRPFAARVGACLLLLAPVDAPAADYWAYRYKNIDVTAVGGSVYAQNAARNADRLGAALSQILSFKSDALLPTHIYILSEDDIKRALGSSNQSTYTTSGFDTTVITDLGGSSQDRYWGVYFGYVGSLLAGDGALRYPFWLRIGVPQVFATPEFEHDRIKTGGVSAGFANTIATGTLIPLRVFLALRNGDPQLHTPAYEAMYEAESWYLAREILVEGRHRKEFGQYLQLMHEGKSEREAFAASFSISYEDLDAMLRADMRGQSHIYIVASPADTSPETAPPRKLAASEVQARLGRVNLAMGHRAEALRLANESLRAEPANENALLVLAAAEAKDGDYGTALKAVDQLAAHGGLSPEDLIESADVLRLLAEAVTGKRASLDVDAATLLSRAKTGYQSALSATDDLRGWAGLAEVYAAQRDVEAARALLPTVIHALERHPRNVNLAYALTLMCAATNQPDEALKFAAIWRENTLDDASRDQAAAYESRLRASLERRAAAAQTPHN
jgi:tetratricopeptide (TPR) repeat protein